jgi:hypothetical protein
MNKTEFLEKRDKWLNEVCDECHEFALEINLDFYVFQTPCDKCKPELLLIGAKPGGNRSYKEVLEEKGYDKRTPSSLYYKENTLVEKPKWETGKGSDVMRARLKKVFNSDNNLDILSETVMMNMLYFNTDDINKVKVEIRKYCIDKTVEFLDIIKPKNILFLTSWEKSLKSYGIKNIKFVGRENSIKQGTLGKHTVYAIPSYGYYSAYSNINCDKMGKSLSEIFQR